MKTGAQVARVFVAVCSRTARDSHTATMIGWERQTTHITPAGRHDTERSESYRLKRRWWDELAPCTAVVMVGFSAGAKQPQMRQQSLSSEQTWWCYWPRTRRLPLGIGRGVSLGSWALRWQSTTDQCNGTALRPCQFSTIWSREQPELRL